MQKVYTIGELTKILPYKHETIRMKVANGDIKGHKIGRKWVVTEQEVNKMLGGE